jgi:hypothetical protein
LADEELLAAAQDDGDAGARAHLESCGACREGVARARQGLGLAKLAGAVPEPSPLYWESFRVQVGERIAAARPTSWSVRLWRRFGIRFLVPAAAAAALLIALIPAWPRHSGSAAGPAKLLPAWQALPASADDSGLDVLRGLALEGTDLQAATECRGVVACLDDMDDEESQDLADALRGLPGKRS